MILCIGTTPAAQRVMIFRKLVLEGVNRAVLTLDGVAGKSVNVAKVLHALGQPVVGLPRQVEIRQIPVTFPTRPDSIPGARALRDATPLPGGAAPGPGPGGNRARGGRGKLQTRLKQA